jgi:hypothetical protein
VQGVNGGKGERVLEFSLHKAMYMCGNKHGVGSVHGDASMGLSCEKGDVAYCNGVAKGGATKIEVIKSGFAKDGGAAPSTLGLGTMIISYRGNDVNAKRCGSGKKNASKH